MRTILDLFCGAGGAAMGIYQAARKRGVEVKIIGIDNQEQPHYPFNFIKADLTTHTIDNLGLRPVFIWASPPCQAYSVGSRAARKRGKIYPDLVERTKEILDSAAPCPSVIENVIGAPIRPDLKLCGRRFGLKVYRHRVFEIEGFEVRQPKHNKHDTRMVLGRDYFSVAGKVVGSIKQWRSAMGIQWMNREEIVEAVPPAYAKYIFNAYLDSIYPPS